MAEFLTTNGHTVFVDDADLERAVAAGNWMAIRKRNVFYAVRNEYLGRIEGKQKTRRIYLHRFLAGEDGMVTDHINGNGLDNRRTNLRSVSTVQNSRNRGAQSNSASGVRGVYWHKQRGKWAAKIRHNGKNVSLGLYQSIDDARAAFRAGAERLGWSPEDCDR